MKKIVLITLFTSLLMFTGCQNAIFEAIREDVPPEEATVSGNIGAITRFTVDSKEFLFVAAEGGLKYKQKDINEHGAWKSFPVSFDLIHYSYDANKYIGEQILTVLANDSALFLVTAQYNSTTSEGLTYPSKIKVWTKSESDFTRNENTLSSDTDWTAIVDENWNTYFPVSYNKSDDIYTTLFNVFQTNAPQKAHRSAFVRTTKNSTVTYYEFTTGGLTEYTVNPTDIITTSTGSSDSVAYSAFWYGGGVKFCTSRAATTNETYENTATHYYFTDNNSKLYWGNDASTGSINTNSSYTISALATCKDSILIGFGTYSDSSSGGIGRAFLDSYGKPTTYTSDFDTNASFQITTSYKVLTLLNANPDQDEIDSNLYAAITFYGTSLNFDNIGLWSYYKNRGNWNRE